MHWDILVVDEAHYLRNRESQAWQAVNALPRQFLLLLTATPVQNSLEELYNLVTLLQPGQLPSPKEFRARFLDPKRPRQPREPEELRRLLGQVMIRNTRANAGVNLPPRRAETVLFAPEENERAFWEQWDGELRARLAALDASQSNLWGRLLLQTAGSSPAAWRAALEKFPDTAAARAWREQAPLEASWRRKCELIPPLAKGEGGAVVFTQFLETQAALADFLRRGGVETFVINGATPAPERQPITEAFRQRGGALLLTHSGTEGRNLQFSHRLVNFDLPWNPMEIEQRIGRCTASASNTRSISTISFKPELCRNTCCRFFRKNSTSLNWSSAKPAWCWASASAATNSPKKSSAAGAKAKAGWPKPLPDWAMNSPPRAPPTGKSSNWMKLFSPRTTNHL